MQRQTQRSVWIQLNVHPEGRLGAGGRRTERENAALCKRFNPHAAATLERTSASVRNCRAMAPRDAPSATRIETSLVRCTARPRSRFETFVHATRNTNAYSTGTSYTATRRSANAQPCGEAMRRADRTPSFVRGCSAPSRLAIRANSPLACAKVTPSRRRPTARTRWPEPHGWLTDRRRSGTQSFSEFGKPNPSGITTMIVAGCPFMRTMRPITAESPAYRSRQTAADGDPRRPGDLVFCWRNSRPSAGRTRVIVNASAVTRAASRCPGRSSPLILMVCIGRYAPNASNENDF